MNKYKLLFLATLCLSLLSIGVTTLAYQNQVVSAGPDLYITSGQTTILQGYGFDPNGYALNYYWSCTGGLLSNYNIAQPIYSISTNNYNYQNTNTCTLTVTNSIGVSSSDSMIIYVDYNNNNSSLIQTNSASYISNYQATLNGTLSNTNYSAVNYVYFQWGTTTSYGSETSRQLISYNGSFVQNIANLNAGTTYHFRAVIQNGSNNTYGQDMTFTTAGSGYYGNNALTVSKKVINLTSGNISWSSSINASPSDILSFSITLQASGQDAHNIVVRDILPSTLIYKGNLMVGISTYAGDINSGLNIGTVYANQPIVISYQAQVAPAVNFNLGINTINNSSTITSTDRSTQTSLATVIVNKSLVYGASDVSTGLTNNIIADSFFIPLLLILLMVWLYLSGMAYRFAERLKKTNK